MEKKHKKFAIISILSFSALCGVVLFSASKSNNFESIFTKAAKQEFSLSFTRTDAHSDSGTTYVYGKETQVGNECYLISTGGNSRSSGYLATIPSMYDSTIAAVSMQFYKDASGTTPFKHQTIDSVTIITSGNVTLSIQASRDGVTFREKGTLDCTSSGATYSLFDEYDRFLLITESSRASSARSIKEVDISYECESAIENFTSGSFEAVVKDNSDLDAPMSIYFNSDNYGYYKFYHNGTSAYYYTLFTWEFDANLYAIKMTYTSSPAGSIS